jgi:hypothetical protein
MFFLSEIKKARLEARRCLPKDGLKNSRQLQPRAGNTQAVHAALYDKKRLESRKNNSWPMRAIGISRPRRWDISTPHTEKTWVSSGTVPTWNRMRKGTKRPETFTPSGLLPDATATTGATGNPRDRLPETRNALEQFPITWCPPLKPVGTVHSTLLRPPCPETRLSYSPSSLVICTTACLAGDLEKRNRRKLRFRAPEARQARMPNARN